MRQPADHRFGKRVSSVAALCAALVFAAGCGGEAPSGAAAPDVVASALCASAKL